MQVANQAQLKVNWVKVQQKKTKPRPSVEKLAIKEVVVTLQVRMPVIPQRLESISSQQLRKVKSRTLAK